MDRLHEKFVKAIMNDLLDKKVWKSRKERLKHLVKYCDGFLGELENVPEDEEEQVRWALYAGTADWLEAASVFAFLKESDELDPEEEALFEKWMVTWEKYRKKGKFFTQLPLRPLSIERSYFREAYGFNPPRDHWWWWEEEGP
jgi:hypothetical protein